MLSAGLSRDRQKRSPPVHLEQGFMACPHCRRGHWNWAVHSRHCWRLCLPGGPVHRRVIIKSDRLSGMKTIQRRGDSRADGSAPAAPNDFRLWNIKFGLCQDNTGTPMNTDNVVSGYDLSGTVKVVWQYCPGDQQQHLPATSVLSKIQRKSIAAVEPKLDPLTVTVVPETPDEGDMKSPARQAPAAPVRLLPRITMRSKRLNMGDASHILFSSPANGKPNTGGCQHFD